MRFELLRSVRAFSLEGTIPNRWFSGHPLEVPPSQ